MSNPLRAPGPQNQGGSPGPSYSAGHGAQPLGAGTGSQYALPQNWRVGEAQTGNVLTEEFERNRKPKLIVAGAVTTLVIVLMLVAGGVFLLSRSSGGTTVAGGDTEFTTWADSTYGTFDEITAQGDSGQVVDLPAEAKGVYITYEYQGSGIFRYQGIDKNNATSYQVSESSYGMAKGSAFAVLDDGFSERVTRINVSSDGAWQMSIKPVAQIPDFQQSGEGTAVMQYNGEAADLHMTHDGTSNFIVYSYSQNSEFPELMVNEVGQWDGIAPIMKGPSIITISADGAWTASDS